MINMASKGSGKRPRIMAREELEPRPKLPRKTGGRVSARKGED